MTKYGRSPWLDWCPKSRAPAYPRFRGPLEGTVVIVGGGLTGCATAYALAAQGTKAILLEAERIGHGSSALASGWISPEPDVGFAALEQMRGLRSARRAWQAWRRAALDFAALLRRLEIPCRLEPCDLVTAAIPPTRAAWLAKDLKARRAAGLDVSGVAARALSADLALPPTTGIRSHDGASIDPYRACLGLAAAAAARGCALFERSRVAKITFGRRTAEVHTDAGRIRTSRVIVTTGVPTPLFKPLVRHVWVRTTYLAATEPLPAKVRHLLGRRSAVLCDAANPRHIVRWVDDERLLVVGADQPSPSNRLRDQTIVQRTGQLMYELSTLYPDVSGALPAYGWDAEYARSADGLPLLGPHRNYPHHLFAFADSSHSVTGAYLASRVLLRHHLGELDPSDEVFGFAR